MANVLNATIHQPFVNSDGTLKEFRVAPFGIINAFKESTNYYSALTPTVREKLMTAQNQSVYLKALKNQGLTVTSAKSFVVPANLRESDKILVTYITHAVGRHFIPEMYTENYITMEEDVAGFIEQAGKDIANAKEVQLLALLESYKTQALPYNSGANDGFTFNAGTDSVEITKASQATRWFEKMATIFEENGLSNDKLLISSPGVNMALADNNMYGVTNDKNLQQTYPGIYTSRNVTNANRFTGYMIENGSVGVVSNYQKTYLENNTQIPGITMGITRYNVPYINEPVEFLHKIGGVDLSAISPDYARFQTVVGEELALFHSYAILRPYNSDIANNVNPIVKIIGLA